MRYGICPLSVIPVRNAPSIKGEMRTQLLFGELVEFLENRGKLWVKVRIDWDNTIGWVNSRQIQSITPDEFEHYVNNYGVALELLQAAVLDSHFLPLSIGSCLPLYDGVRFQLADAFCSYSGQVIIPDKIPLNADLLLKIARRFLYAPELQGGRSPFGIDNDGFVQLVFKILGLRLPRKAIDQIYVGETIDFIDQTLPGDIAFLESSYSRKAHTGIVMSDRRIIHCSGRVRIDKLDHFGIYCKDENRYTFKLRLIKRILPLMEQISKSEEKISEKSSNQIELF